MCERERKTLSNVLGSSDVRTRRFVIQRTERKEETRFGSNRGPRSCVNNRGNWKLEGTRGSGEERSRGVRHATVDQYETASVEGRTTIVDDRRRGGSPEFRASVDTVFREDR